MSLHIWLARLVDPPEGQTRGREARFNDVWICSVIGIHGLVQQSVFLIRIYVHLYCLQLLSAPAPVHFLSTRQYHSDQQIMDSQDRIVGFEDLFSTAKCNIQPSTEEVVRSRRQCIGNDGRNLQMLATFTWHSNMFVPWDCANSMEQLSTMLFISSFNRSDVGWDPPVLGWNEYHGALVIG